MPTPDLALGPEWALLELLCLGLTNVEEQQAFDDLLKTSPLDWGVLLEQAIRHKMLPLLSFHTLTPELEPSVPRRIREHFRSVLDVNRHKRTLWYREASRIITALEERGVRVVGRKDVAFESTIYNGNGSRRFGDIDLLVAPKDRDAVLETLPQLGYQLGLFDWQTQALVPIPRQHLMIFRMNPDHLPVHSRLTGDSILQWFEIDFANSLTWTGSSFDIPLDVAMAEIRYQPVVGFPDMQIPCLLPPFEFISTVLHLFREAWFARWLEWEQDVDLTKFSDVVRLWKRYQDVLTSGSFVQILEQYDLVAPVVWVLEHLDRTLHTGIVPALGLAGRVTEEWLFSGRASGKQLYRWQGSMRQRLYSKDREALFVEVQETA